MRKWDRVTYGAWCTLLEGKEGEGERMEDKEKRLGLGFRRSANFCGEDSDETREGGMGIWWREGVVREFQVLSSDQFPTKQDQGQEEREESKLVFGVGYKSICFDPPTYLTYLFQRIQSLGATVFKSKLDVKHHLSGVVASAKSLLGEKSMEDMDLFINCAGLSARHFVSEEEAEKLFPIRGQTLLINGEAKIARTITNLKGEGGEEVVYVIPRPGSGTTIFGGCKQVGNFDTEIDERLSERILERVGAWGVAEEIRGQDGKFEVLSTQVGFRPGRRGGPRVEIQEGKVEGVWVVHSYGHSGAGYQNSIGCAEEVRGLVESLFRDGE